MVLLAESVFDDGLKLPNGNVLVSHEALAGGAILQSKADKSRPTAQGVGGYAGSEVATVEAEQVRSLIGEFVCALRERNFWTDGEGAVADRVRGGEVGETAEDFCAWIELILLPHVAAALAATQRPEPVKGFGTAALEALGNDPANAGLLRLAHEIEQALQRDGNPGPLDEALLRAESSEEAADAFYSLFANTRLIVPLATNEAGQPVQDDEQLFSPLTVTLDDIEYLPVFDSEERLRDWAGETVLHTRMSGMALAVTLESTGTVHVVLNPGSGCEKVFVPDELASLRSQLTKVGDDLWLCPPGNVAPEAVQALCSGLAGLPQLQSAHLAVRLAESADGAGLLLLAFRTRPEADEALVERVSALCTEALGGFHLELLFNGRDPLAEDVASAVPAFYAVV
ncbi:MAG: SseB family protein [Planctomycetes bacterium]|nr:SseB family protein [Planctomycetota bacterium]